MSLSNEIEELLSGYLDNQLDADELRRAKIALSDPTVQARYDELCQMRQDLKDLATKSPCQLPGDFSQRVLAAAIVAKASSDSRGLGAFVQATASESMAPLPAPIIVEFDAVGRRNQPLAWVASVVGLAATFVLAVWVPYANQPKSASPTQIASETQGNNDQSQSLSGSANQDSSATIESQNSPVEPVPPVRFVRRDDLNIQYVMTLDLELSEDSSMLKSLVPLMHQNGIELIQGAKVEGDVKTALDKMRVTLPPEDSPLPSEVYLLRAPSLAVSKVVEAMMNDLDAFPVARLGLAFELPSDPLLDRLSMNNPGSESNSSVPAGNGPTEDASALSRPVSAGPIALSQTIADAISNYVDSDDAFAAPLVSADQEEFRASPFDSIPPQGKLVGSSKRTKTAVPTLDSIGDGKFAFLLLFIRQR